MIAPDRLDLCATTIMWNFEPSDFRRLTVEGEGIMNMPVWGFGIGNVGNDAERSGLFRHVSDPRGFDTVVLEESLEWMEGSCRIMDGMVLVPCRYILLDRRPPVFGLFPG